MPPTFSDITVERPTDESLARDYAQLHARLDSGNRVDAIQHWDWLQRRYGTWSAMTDLRSSQDMTDPVSMADKAHLDEIDPEVTRHDVAVKQRLLADPDRAGLEKVVGTHAVNLWKVSVTTFNPAIKSDLKEEAKLSTRYSALLAGGTVRIGDREMGLSQVDALAQSPDRNTRHEAEKARWNFFADKGEELDQIYDDMVKLRHGMAKKLRHDSYIPLAYQLRAKIGYDQNDIAAFRDQIVADVVPLAARIMESRRNAAGLDKIYYWDESLADPMGNPRPAGGPELLLERAKIVAAKMDPRLGEFVAHMIDGGFTDLESRPGKANSTFSTFLPDCGMPFAFDNANGTFGDVNAIVHEIIGHGFQNYRSRNIPLVGLIVPPDDIGETHSKSAEYLSYPYISPLVKEGEADRYRRTHLERSILAIPASAYIDHFQHEIYANPSASPAERHEISRELQKKYAPWRDTGDIEHLTKGGLWHDRRHIFKWPFYSIEYNQGACLALQFLAESQRDYPAAMDRYVGLCSRGGEAPFLELVRDAGLKSPFEAGALKEGVGVAARLLGLEEDQPPKLSMLARGRPTADRRPVLI